MQVRQVRMSAGCRWARCDTTGKVRFHREQEGNSLHIAVLSYFKLRAEEGGGVHAN